MNSTPKLNTLASLIIIALGVHPADPQSDRLNFSTLKNKISKNIRKYTLKNGIRVILMKNGITPTIACYLKIGVGSSDEPFDQSGTAHFLEHLLFKGTNSMGTTDFHTEKIYLKQIKVVGERVDRVKLKLLDPLLSKEEEKNLRKNLDRNQKLLNALQKLVRKFIVSEEDSKAYSIGGGVGYNAYTSSDVTNYQVLLPKNRLELWAWLESSRFLKPVFREFYIERKVIQEERKMRYDSKPPSALYELFVKTSFGMSPYGKPVIGFASNIPRLKWSDTERFFYTKYIPSKMVITIVGAVEFEPTYNILRKYFERLPSRKAAEFPPIGYEQSKVSKRAMLEADYTPYLITGWYKPSIFHEHDIVFDIVSELLTSGLHSRLIKRLVVEEKIVQSIRSHSGIPGNKLDNMFALFIRLYSEEQYEKALEIVYEELKILKEEGPTEKELKKIKTRYYSRLISSLESNSGLADSLSYYEVILNDYTKFFDSLSSLDRITPRDVQDVIQKYFSKNNNVTVYIQKDIRK